MKFPSTLLRRNRFAAATALASSAILGGLSLSLTRTPLETFHRFRPLIRPL